AGFLGRFERGRGGHDALLFSVLIDQQNAGNSDLIIDARSILGRRRGHGTTNRLCSCTVGTRGPPQPTLASVYDQGALADQEERSAKDKAAANTVSTATSFRSGAWKTVTWPRGP